MPLRPLAAPPRNEGVLWASETTSLLERGAVLPFVSNYLLPSIFGVSAGELASAWAEAIGSPLSTQDNTDLAKVAQYCSVRSKSVRKARVEYHSVIKSFLLNQAHDDQQADQDYVHELTDSPERLEAASFSQIARDLGYPNTPDPRRDPMRLLADLPLPMYITTGQHTFLEAALENTNKHPVTEIFYWDEPQDTIPSVFQTQPEYRPSAERPLVYHLFGVDTYPESLVLSEDDYVTILMRLSELKREVKVSDAAGGGSLGAKRDIPSDMKTALSGSGLLLLGYDIHSWEFRVLFRWLMRYIGASREGRSAPDAFCMQLPPSQEPRSAEKNQQVQDFLTQFFEQRNFSVYWGDLQNCVYELWSRWNQS
jgi:SIR2-like protein